MSICHHCGKKIEGDGVPFRVDTYVVRMHPYCRRWYKAKPITAQEAERPIIEDDDGRG